MIRVRLEIDASLVHDLEYSKCIFPISNNLQFVSDLAIEIQNFLRSIKSLTVKPSNIQTTSTTNDVPNLSLSIDGYALLPSLQISILRDNDVVSVRNKDITTWWTKLETNTHQKEKKPSTTTAGVRQVANKIREDTRTKGAAKIDEKVKEDTTSKEHKKGTTDTSKKYTSETKKSGDTTDSSEDSDEDSDERKKQERVKKSKS